MVNKKAVIICSILALLIVLGVVVFQIKKWEEEENKIEETATNQTNIASNQNLVENQTEVENVVEENTIQEENTTNEIVQNQTQTQVQGQEEENSEEEPEENEDEKALRLVREEWGEDDTVYYTIDNQSNNTYYISVRSKTTTATLAEYEVNVTQETVEMK